MTIPERYARNSTAFTKAELENIRSKKFCVVGCGGLGGYVCHALTRFGVGALTLVDGDSFQESNLNRQLFCTPATLRKNKATTVADELQKINTDVVLNAHPTMLTSKNADQLVCGHDVVFDCLDNVSSRLTLASACANNAIPLVHAAISGFHGQVAVVMPQSNLLHMLYPPSAEASNIDSSLGNPVFTPQVAAGIQVTEALKIMIGRGKLLQNTVLYFDLLNNSFEYVDYTHAF